ncbi:MAG: trimethylamine methyltransferase family protein [Alphaproteobacteria bacterium]|nr:trimethylamine methyltransferase family protein [Alphaproteobacteria bacterium]
MSRDQQRSRARARRDAGPLRQLPWRQVRNPFPPVEVLSADQVEAIHKASLEVLEDIGMEFLDDGAIDLLARAGASVDRGNQRVRLDRGLVMEQVAKAPSAITLHARNAERSVTLGGDRINFCMVASPPNCSDLERGKRAGTYQDYCDFLRLAQSLNIIHFLGGYPVEPVDLPPETRHLDCYMGYITLTDRAWHPYSLGRARIMDGLAMLAIARGTTIEALEREPGVISVVNTNSPLRLDGPMIQGLTAMARHNQPVVVTPFTLSGAMSPATIVGALVQQNAEALAGITLLQLVRPGAPALYGGFTSNVDMKSGAPAFGTPEYTKAALAGGQLARRYGLPYRSSNANASNAPDAQAAYESEMSVWGAVMGHANMVLHGAGWLEGGLTASFEKVMIDAEILQMIAEVLRPIEVNEAAFGLDALREVGPGGHFFGAKHTLDRYETAFYTPILSDWRNFETWRATGAQTAAQRAHRLYKDVLGAYQPPPLDATIRTELDAYVARRKKEIAAEG